MSASTRTRRTLAGVYTGYAVALMVFFVPVAFMLWSAFRRSVDITGSLFTITAPLTMENFTGLFSRFPFGQYILNSVIIAGGSTLLGLAIGAPATYAVVRRGSHLVGFIALVARMAPGVMFVLPLFLLSVRIGAPSVTGLNYLVLIAAHLIITLPLCIWLLMPFFEDIPRAVEEAAIIDGAGPWQRFTRIALPLVVPGLAVAVILSFIFSWNFFLFALALANDQTMPLTVIAFNFIGQGSNDYGGLMAASTMIAAPALLLTLFAQRWLVRGLTGGSVK